MMPGIKIITLIGFVSFAAYAQHTATKEVRAIRASAEKKVLSTSAHFANDQRFMERAIELSLIGWNKKHGMPAGSVVVKDGTIIGEGWNKAELLNDPSAHAEAGAIRDACKNIASSSLKGSVMYTSVQPCPMCHAQARRAGVEKIFYCLPGEELRQITGYAQSHEFPQTGEVSHNEILVPEIRMMEDRATTIMQSYKNGQTPSL